MADWVDRSVGARIRATRARIETRRSLGLAVALTAGLAAISGGALAGQAAAASCSPSGHVLAQRGGVVVWTAHGPDSAGNEGDVFVCASPSARTVLLQRSSAAGSVNHASVTQLRFAGNFVGFFLRTNVEVFSKFLIVFDRLHGRAEVRDLAECDYNDECTGPTMTGYRLAADGWVAEVWPLAGQSSQPTGLLASNGKGHYQLDLEKISNLSLSGGMLSWTSNQFGVSSVKLGPDVITPSAPHKRAACGLLTPGEVAAVLGPKPTSSSSSGKCAYTSTAYPGRTLTLTLTTGLSRAQMRARQRALTNTASYCTLGQWWPADDNFYNLEVARADFCGNPGSDVKWVIFANGARVLVGLSSPPANAAVPVAHLTNVAVDRLFGVPIHRRILAIRDVSRS